MKLKNNLVKREDVLDDIAEIYNNINELIEREYYSKYMNKPVKSLSIYEKEILNNYSIVCHQDNI